MLLDMIIPATRADGSGDLFFVSVYQDEGIDSLIKTDVMTEICTTAVIHGRYVNTPTP